MTNDFPPLIVMGVSGCGKSTVGEALARAHGLAFLDGDELHPAASVAKMAAGIPLTDEDRRPWLDAVADALASGRADVIACSALRRAYRDRIRVGVPDAYFIHLDGDPDLIGSRIASRAHEFMPVSLLASQFATLEPLQDDETGRAIPLALTTAEIVDAIGSGVGSASR